MSESAKIAQHTKTNVPGFFGMELNSEDAVSFHGG